MAHRNIIATRLALAALVCGLVGAPAVMAQEAAPAPTTPAPETTTPEAAPQEQPAPADPLANAATAQPTTTAAPVAAPAPANPFGNTTTPSFLETTDRRLRDERPAPTADQIRALRAAEAELNRFASAGTNYRDTIVNIVRREYTRQRRARDESYSRQIREEEALQDQVRDRAIEVFERFIARYPSDPTYTPDAMFRLGELYYERSALQFQAAVEASTIERERRQNANESLEGMPDVQKNFGPTIDLYRRLVRQFPTYRRIDGVFYLIGYCLNEMNELEEARQAWLNLVCGNKFTYTGTLAAGNGTSTSPDPSHPSLTMDGNASPAGVFVDPYADCTAASTETQFIGEVWLRIGEYHFDNDPGRDGINRAISAYSKVLALPEDRNYNLALYKTAWSYYRDSRFPDALHAFEQLVQWSDDEQARTGRAGTELRAEAVQYIAVTFAYVDWNEDSTPDAEQGMPTGFGRVQDPNLMPQDRPWTEEVYYQLGLVYFDEAKYREAIEVWNFAIGKWPLSPRAPEITNQIARAYARNNEPERELEARALLANYGIGTTWYNANTAHPAEQRRAEELAEYALIQAALNHHQRAQSLRAQGIARSDASLIRAAKEKYRLAAEAYRAYIQRYPNNPQAYEINYNLADALFWSEDYESAAREYAQVRDSNLDNTYLSESARRVVESLKRLVDQAVANRQLEVRSQPPEPSGTPLAVAPIAMPELVQRLAQAREIYVARVDERHDTEHARAPYDFNNALLLYMYGYWPQAKERFTRIFVERCSGDLADDTGRVAYLNLRNMAVKLNQAEEVARLAAVLRQRQCTFATAGDATGANGQQMDCDHFCARPENAEHPFCIACQDLNNDRYRQAVEIFGRAAQISSPEHPATSPDQIAEAQRLYEDAASRLIRAVNSSPNDPQAPIALERAAIALQRTSRFDAASRIYQRIIDEVGPRRGDTPDQQESLDKILANAYFQLAFSANENFDYERAIQNYRVLTDTPRFANSTIAKVVEFRTDALVNVANILQYQQRYADAATYYRRVAQLPAPAASAPQSQRDDFAATVQNAWYNIAEMSFKRRAWADAIRDMEAFIERYRADANAGELVIQAYWRIVEARKASNQGTRIRQALQDVVDAFARLRLQPGSLGAEYAAQAKFELVDPSITPFESFAITTGRAAPATMNEYVTSITNQINAGSSQAVQLAAGYDPIPAYGRPTWTIGAFVRQGRVYEVLARAILNTPFVTPRDMATQMARLDADSREQIRVQVQDRIQQVLDEKTRPVECFAVVRYALAVRAARVGNIDNEYTRLAFDRLAAYGEERVNECVTQQSTTDTTFARPSEHEFARANRGQNLDIRADIVPPPLAPEDD